MFLRVKVKSVGTGQQGIEALLPEGYRADPDNTPIGMMYKIFTEGAVDEVAHAAYYGIAGVIFVANEDNAGGQKFWQDFSMAHPNESPFDLLFAILYKDEFRFNLDPENIYRSREEAMGEIQHFVNANAAALVEYRRGMWSPGCLFFDKLQMILPTGKLAEDDHKDRFIPIEDAVELHKQHPADFPPA